MIEYKHFYAICKKAGGHLRSEPLADYKFDRDMFLTSADGTTVRLEWFKNLMNAYIGDIVITWFDRMSIDGYYPNNYKTNLNLFQGDKKICVIPIEKCKSENPELLESAKNESANK